VSLQLKDAPASGVQNHIVKEAGPGKSLPPTYDPANAPVDFGFRGYFAPIKNLMEAANLLQQAPSLANVPNPAMLTMPAPRVNPPTGWIHSGTWADLASGGDVYFSTTSETGDRSLALNTVNAEATSFYTAVIGGQSYQGLCTWQAPDLGDQLEISVLLYNASRVLTGSVVLFSGAPAVVNTWQTDGQIFPTSSTDRLARFKVKKAAGPPILVDRVELSVMQQAADCYTSGGLVCGAGTTTIVWDKTAYNYDGFYNSASGQFTASRQGTYRFSVYTYFVATVSGTLAFLALGMNLAGVGVIQSSTKEFASGTTQGDHWFHTPPVQLDRGAIVTFELTVAAAGSLPAGATTCVGYRVNDTER